MTHVQFLFRRLLRVAVLLLLGAAPARAQEGTIVVANMHDDTVWLIDATTGRHRVTVETRIAPHEVALSRDGTVAAVTNYGDAQRGPGNLVQFIDVRSGILTHEIEVRGYERLHGAAFLEGDSLLALSSERTDEVLVVGVFDGMVRRAIPSGGRGPHMITWAGGWLWAANVSAGSVSRIDPAGGRPTRAWPAGERTEGVAATPDGEEVWTGSREDGVVVGVAGDDGRIVAHVEGFRVPYRLAATADGQLIVVSDPADGTVTLIDRKAAGVVEVIGIEAASKAQGFAPPASPQGLAVSGDSRWAFVSAKGIDRVVVIDLDSGMLVRFLATGRGPDGVAFSPVVGP